MPPSESRVKYPVDGSPLTTVVVAADFMTNMGECPLCCPLRKMCAGIALTLELLVGSSLSWLKILYYILPGTSTVLRTWYCIIF